MLAHEAKTGIGDLLLSRTKPAWVRNGNMKIGSGREGRHMPPHGAHGQPASARAQIRGSPVRRYASAPQGESHLKASSEQERLDQRGGSPRRRRVCAPRRRRSRPAWHRARRRRMRGPLSTHRSSRGCTAGPRGIHGPRSTLRWRGARQAEIAERWNARDRVIAGRVSSRGTLPR